MPKSFLFLRKFTSEVGNERLSCFPHIDNFLNNESFLFKTKELHTLKKTNTMKNNNTEAEHFIQFLFLFADRSKKALAQLFKVQQMHVIMTFSSAEIQHQRQSNYITCRQVIIKSPIKHTEEFCFSNKHFSETIFHF